VFSANARGTISSGTIAAGVEVLLLADLGIEKAP